jgi:hypothetical protein
MRAIKTFVSGLLLSAVLLLPTVIRAAELEPFFTTKFSSVNSFIGIVQKIGTMAGFADTDEFKEAIQMVKEVKGFNLDSIIGFAAAVDKDDNIVPILLLPITDIRTMDIPSAPGTFDGLLPFLTPRGAGVTEINGGPVGTFVAFQKEGYLVLVPEDAAGQMPADARKFFADLEKYTFGVKLDLEKVEFDTLEAKLFGWVLMFAMMQDPGLADQIENAINLYRELYKEFAVMTGGISFNVQTADVELSGTMVPRKGSDMAKSLAGYKTQPTIFSGFRGTPGNVVFSFGDSASMPPLPNTNALMELSLKQYDQYEALLEGILEQIEMDDETGEITKIAKEAIDTVKKIIDKESKRGTSDSACSFNFDGTLLGAFDTVSLADIQKLGTTIADFASQQLAPVVAGFEIDINSLVKMEYVTVEGFKVSSFKFPMEKLLPLIPEPDAADALKGLSPGIFWAVKDAGGKQAIAVSGGLDFAKVESTFKSALEKTKTPTSVQKPVGEFSIQGLGKFLQQTVMPIAAKTAPAEELAVFKKVSEMLATTGNDAAITLNAEMKPDRIETGYRISGKVIQSLITVIKFVSEEGGFRPPSGDF